MKVLFLSCFILFAFQFNHQYFLLRNSANKEQLSKISLYYFSYKRQPMALMLKENYGLTVMTVCQVDNKGTIMKNSCMSEAIVSSNLEKEFCFTFRKTVKSFFEPTADFRHTKPSCDEILEDWQKQKDKHTTK